MEQIEAGRVVNAHGIRGDVKVLPAGCEPELLIKCRNVYIGDVPYRVLQGRVHKGCALLRLQGVETMDAALALKDQSVFIRRQDAHLPDGVYFAAELLGLTALDSETGEVLGTLEEVLPYPAHDVYHIQGDRLDFLVPAVPVFIRDVDLGAGTISMLMMGGLL